MSGVATVPHPVEGYVKQVHRSRRAAARAVERIEAGTLEPQEVDFCELLFGQVGPEEKLARLGLLDDGGLCDELVGVLRHRIKDAYEDFARDADLEKLLLERFPDVVRRNLQRPPAEVAPAADPQRRDRNDRRVEARAASLLAVHLCQRAMYEALGAVLRDLVLEQSQWAAGRMADAPRMHAPLKMDVRHVEEADAVIERLRREHLAGRPPRASVPWEVRRTPVQPKDGDGPVDLAVERAKAFGIAAE